MKVIHIINNLKIGGAEKVLALLLKNLKDYENLELSVVSLEGTGSLENDIIGLGIKVKNFKYNLFRNHFRKFDPYFRLRLFLYLKREKPDLIHGHLMVGQDITKLTGGMLGVPVVTTQHDTLLLPGIKQKIINRYLTKAVGVSREVGEYLEKICLIPKEKIAVIPNGIEVDEYKNSEKNFDEEKPIFLYIGRLFKTKGIEFAIQGLAKLKEDYPNLEFLIYGKQVFEEDFKKWKKMVKQNQWDFVKFMGPTEDVPGALKKGDIFLLPSKSEGFAMAVLEAAAAGKPIIATKTGSIPEMVEDGKSGYFVEYGSSEQIYKAAKKILDDGKVEIFGKRSKELVKDKFSIKKVAKMYYNLYLSILNKNA